MNMTFILESRAGPIKTLTGDNMSCILDILSLLDYYQAMKNWISGFPNSQDETGQPTGASAQAYALYKRRFQIGFLTFVGSTVASAFAPHAARPWLDALEFAAIAFLAFAYVKYAAAWDELQQRIFLNAGANALLVTILVVWAIFLAQAAIGFPPLDTVWYAELPIVAWLVCYIIARKRYCGIHE